jgi:hypothetical protein
MGQVRLSRRLSGAVRILMHAPAMDICTYYVGKLVLGQIEKPVFWCSTHSFEFWNICRHNTSLFSRPQSHW